MNTLLHFTKIGIIERQAFSMQSIFDNYILAAIEAYDVEGSVKRRAQSFMTGLAPLWKLYRKEAYVPLFNNFIDMEIGLEVLSEKHSSHVNHVIQEFLFGYNILVNSKYIKDSYRFDEGRNDQNSKFGELIFSWMAASLFHDVGYDIERAPEEEALREKKNSFWNFMTKRAVTDNPLDFSIDGSAQNIIQNYILRDINEIPGAPSFSYNEFQSLFRRQVGDRPGWYQFDHGLISAVKYLIELEKLQNQNGGNYLNWEPNRHASLAMALHNFRHKDCDLRLSFGNPMTLIPYLLIVSDEVQEWEREREDIDAQLPEDVKSGGKAKRCTNLVGITFKERHAYVIINHELKDASLKPIFEKYFDEKLILQKKHYPIRVLFPQLRKDIREKVIKATTSLAMEYAINLIPIVGGVLSGLVELRPNALQDIKVSTDRISMLSKIASTQCEKKLLIPTMPESTYEIYLDHRIDGDPYLTVVFPC